MSPPICLVREDEPLIALDLETYLTGSGLAVMGPFSTSTEALRWIETGKTPDVALLDFQLGDGSCKALIDALLKRGVPIVMQSGLRPDPGMPPEVRSLPWLSKPMRYDDLRRALAQALSARPSTRAAKANGEFHTNAIRSRLTSSSRNNH